MAVVSSRDKVSRRKKKFFRTHAFTLVDVMVALGIASMALLALLGTSFITFKINHKARLRDNARSVLRTYVDQFQRIGYSDESTGANVPRRLFETTQSPTGQGLRWGLLSNEVPNGPLSTAPLEVEIGSPGAPQRAYVTREVSYVNASGNASSTRVDNAAGFMIRAKFTIEYSISGTKGRPITQSVSTLRLID